LRWASLSTGAPFGEPGGGLVYQGLSQLDEGGSRDGAFLFKRLHGGASGGAPSLGTLEDMLTH